MIRTIKFYFPLLILLLILVVGSVFLKFLENPGCTYFFGINASLGALLLACFLAPATFTTASLYLFYFSLKSRGQNFYPPENIPLARISHEGIKESG